MQRWIAVLLMGWLWPTADGIAEVVSSSETHFLLSHQAVSTLSPEAQWEKLIHPERWWHPDHTYSGKAENLSLDLRPGGLWAEHWDGGSVSHGTVMYVSDGKVLRLNAPFGPLQQAGAYSVWTITVKAQGEGSMVVFDEVVSGPPTANLAQLATAVNGVKAEAIRRLTEAGPG